MRLDQKPPVACNDFFGFDLDPWPKKTHQEYEETHDKS